MKDRILHEMAADLGVDKYKYESEIQYCNRLLYSALASWIKASALDQPVTNIQEDKQGVSRRHIIHKCTSTLNELLKRYPESRSWFETELDGESPVNVLQSRLIRHGDLLQVGFETNLFLAGSSRVALSARMECRKGEVLCPETYYSGLAMLQKTQDNITFKLEPISDVTTWLEDYVRTAWWKDVGQQDEKIQYFNAYRKSVNNYSCWQSERPKSVDGLWFVRRNINKGGYEYFLLRQQDEDLYKHQIDPFLQTIGEYRRFMIAMRNMAGNNIPVQVYRYTDHINVKLRIHLPQKESSLLETYAWPHNSIADKLEWDMDKDVWDYIKRYFSGLGIKWTEDGELDG